MPIRNVTRRDALKALGVGSVTLGGGALGHTLYTDVVADDMPNQDTVVPQIIGHRGAAGLEPENTIRAIERAIDLGVDGVEIDVQPTQDGTLVVIHDPILNRKTTGTGLVSETPYDDLKSVRVKGEEPIPTFDEALSVLAEADVSVFIEIKANGITEEVLSMVDSHGLRNRTTLLSFETEHLTPANDVDIPLGLLGSLPLDGLTETAVAEGYDYSLPHYVPSQMQEFSDKTWNTNILPGVWSLVPTREGVRESLEASLAVVVTNRPDYGLEEREHLYPEA